MDQLTPLLDDLLGIFRSCFRQEVFVTFRLLVGAWIVCLGPHTISRVWETTGRAATHDHSAAFRLFSQAAWNWDELARLLLVWLVALLVPGARIWLVVDDTLCHKRGAKVAFGGIFLDAVLSSKKHKVFRFGHNWVTLGVLVWLPCRPERPFCLNVLWRLAQKKTTANAATHQTKPQRAADMVRLVAQWFDTYQLYVVADSAYLSKHLLHERPAHVQAIGPLRWDAVLTEPLAETSDGRRKKGSRLPTPREMLADQQRWPAETYEYRKGQESKTLEITQIPDLCWYHGAGPVPVQLVLIHDPDGGWRDEVLLCTDPTLSVEEVILGYCQRWSVEVAYCDSKQLLGFHDPQVWCPKSVQRAVPMAWFVGVLVVLWYALEGIEQRQVRRERPWLQAQTGSDVCGHAGDVPLAPVAELARARLCGRGRVAGQRVVVAGASVDGGVRKPPKTPSHQEKIGFGSLMVMLFASELHLGHRCEW